MNTYRTHVGLDVHARSIVAQALDEDTGELTSKRFSNDPTALIDWLYALAGPTRTVYEAGPTGYDLARRLADAKIPCVIAAPSKLQRPSGDRVKTDKNDALHLARLLQLDQITPVRVPTIDEETARDLVRAREDCRHDLMSARHRLSKLLLRHGHVYDDGGTWTQKHDAWIRQHRDGTTAYQYAFDAAYEAVTQVRVRRDRLDAEIERMAVESEYAAIVARLGCLRGMGALTSLALAVEVADWDRFTGNTIGSYLGLTPSEYSSGGSRQLGGITKTGNSHARRLLVEAAWHHRKELRPGPASVLTLRQERAPQDARLRGQAGNERLHRQWVKFVTRRKKSTIANVAIARELAGWCWSLAIMRE